jgi:aldehyde dehydrogenase (NAD+)
MSDLIQELTAPNKVKYQQPLGLFINNEFVKSTSGEKFATINPAYVFVSFRWNLKVLTSNSNEQEIASVYAASPEDVDIAVKAARKAFKDPSWKDLPPTARGKLLNKLADLVEENANTLATIETWDNGTLRLSSGIEIWVFWH